MQRVLGLEGLVLDREVLDWTLFAKAFTKSGKRKISTVAKPWPFVPLYLPEETSITS
jgi:hypothetical protein